MKRYFIYFGLTLLCIGCSSSGWSYSTIKRSDPEYANRIQDVVESTQGLHMAVVIAGHAPTYDTSSATSAEGVIDETHYDHVYLTKATSKELQFYTYDKKSKQINVPITSVKRIDQIHVEATRVYPFQRPSFTIGDVLLGMLLSFCGLVFLYAMADLAFRDLVVKFLLSPAVLIVATLILGYGIYRAIRDEESNEPKRPASNVDHSWFIE